LEVVTPLLADQLAGAVRLLFCGKLQLDTTRQIIVTVSALTDAIVFRHFFQL
jgi:hypothetical protein